MKQLAYIATNRRKAREYLARLKRERANLEFIHLNALVLLGLGLGFYLLLICP